MLKVLTAQQTKELDAFTIANDKIASIDLMERACDAFITWLTGRFNNTKKIGVVCGTGNNGGDGLGIARLLSERGYKVSVWIVKGSASTSQDFKTNLERLSDKVERNEIITIPRQEEFAGYDILIDAIFGSGLSRSPEGIYAETIAVINNVNAIRVAVDLPSGLMADKPLNLKGEIVKAPYTVSFQLPKLAFFLPENNSYTGEWFVVDIGLNKDFIAQAKSFHYLLEERDVIAIKKVRSKFSHKGTFGKALLVVGSYGKMGAAVLSSKATLRSGVGLLTLHIPKCGYNILQTAVPEAMVMTDASETMLTGLTSFEDYDTIGIGPGVGTDDASVKAFAEFLNNVSKPIVIDADALNMLAANRELLHLIPANSILTPHPKEFERLAGSWSNDFERLEKLKAFAASTKTVVILKGAYTSIASADGNVYFNPTGNPGMATGGSGDVLTGILTGLLAQRYEPLHAAQLGVYLHGLAGDIGASQKGMEALIASDIIEFLPHAFQKLLTEAK